MRQAIAALLLALPLTTLAQDATTPPPAMGAAETVPAAPAEYAPVAAPAAPAVPMFTPHEESWSIGAGVEFYSSFGYGSFGTVTASGLVLYVPQPWMAVVTSLERRVAGRTWLVLGGAASYSDERNAWENVTVTNLPAEQKSLVVQASAGLRQALTRASAPVEVSVLALAQGGIFDASVEDGSGVVQDQTGWTAGGSLGLSVERVLVDRLSLRVASQIASFGYTKSESTAPQGVRITSTGFGARVSLAPRLELRLAF